MTSKAGLLLKRSAAVHKPRPALVLSRSRGARCQASAVPCSTRDVHCWRICTDKAAVLSGISTLAAALEFDPSTKYFCKKGKHELFYKSIVQATLELYPTSTYLYGVEDATCVAVVYQFPHTETPSFLQQLTVSLLPMTTVRLDRWSVGAAASEYFDARKKLFYKAHGTFQYIMLFGTHPAQQGRGLGSALMRHLTSLADAAGQYTYVEATTLRNRSFYLNHGFQELQVFQPRDDCPVTYLMARPPAGQATAELPAAVGAAADGTSSLQWGA